MAQSTGKTVAAKKSAAPPKPVKKTESSKPKTAAAKSAATRESAKIPAKKASPGAVPAKGDGEAGAPKAAPKRSVKKAAPAPRSIGGITPEQRYRMICDAAYFRAERRGFVGGNAVQDWLDAEAEIDDLLRGMQA